MNSQLNRYRSMTQEEILRDRLESRHSPKALREMYAVMLHGKDRNFPYEKVPNDLKVEARDANWDDLMHTLCDNWGKFWIRKH